MIKNMSNIDYQNGFAAGMATNGIVSTGVNEIVEQVQADWNQTDPTQPDYIKNKPTITGDGSQAVQSDWEQTDETQPDFIKNKPEISEDVNIDNVYNLRTVVVGEDNDSTSYSNKASTFEADYDEPGIQIIDTNKITYLNKVNLNSEDLEEELDDNGNITGVYNDSEYLPVMLAMNSSENLADLSYYVEEDIMNEITHDILDSSDRYNEDKNIFYYDNIFDISNPFNCDNLQCYKKVYFKDNKAYLDLDFVYNWAINAQEGNSELVEREQDSTGKTTKVIFPATYWSEDDDLNIDNFKIGITEDFQISYYGTLGENYISVPKENTVFTSEEELSEMFSNGFPESIFGYFGENMFLMESIPMLGMLFESINSEEDFDKLPFKKLYYKCNDGFKFGSFKLTYGESNSNYLEFTDYVEVDFSNISDPTKGVLVPSGIFITGDPGDDLAGRELKLYIGTDPNCGDSETQLEYKVSNNSTEYFFDEKLVNVLNKITDNKFMDSSSKTLQDLAKTEDDVTKIDLSAYPNRLLIPNIISYGYDVTETFKEYNLNFLKGDGPDIIRNASMLGRWSGGGYASDININSYVKPGLYYLKGESFDQLNLNESRYDDTNERSPIKKTYNSETQKYEYVIDDSVTIKVDDYFPVLVTEYYPYATNDKEFIKRTDDIQPNVYYNYDNEPCYIKACQKEFLLPGGYSYFNTNYFEFNKATGEINDKYLNTYNTDYLPNTLNGLYKTTPKDINVAPSKYVKFEKSTAGEFNGYVPNNSYDLNIDLSAIDEIESRFDDYASLNDSNVVSQLVTLPGLKTISSNHIENHLVDTSNADILNIADIHVGTVLSEEYIKAYFPTYTMDFVTSYAGINKFDYSQIVSENTYFAKYMNNNVYFTQDFVNFTSTEYIPDMDNQTLRFPTSFNKFYENGSAYTTLKYTASLGSDTQEINIEDLSKLIFKNLKRGKFILLTRNVGSSQYLTTYKPVIFFELDQGRFMIYHYNGGYKLIRLKKNFSYDSNLKLIGNKFIYIKNNQINIYNFETGVVTEVLNNTTEYTIKNNNIIYTTSGSILNVIIKIKTNNSNYSSSFSQSESESQSCKYLRLKLDLNYFKDGDKISTTVSDNIIGSSNFIQGCEEFYINDLNINPFIKYCLKNVDGYRVERDITEFYNIYSTITNTDNSETYGDKLIILKYNFDQGSELFKIYEYDSTSSYNFDGKDDITKCDDIYYIDDYNCSLKLVYNKDIDEFINIRLSYGQIYNETNYGYSKGNEHLDHLDKYSSKYVKVNGTNIYSKLLPLEEADNLNNRYFKKIKKVFKLADNPTFYLNNLLTNNINKLKIKVKEPQLSENTSDKPVNIISKCSPDERLIDFSLSCRLNSETQKTSVFGLVNNGYNGIKIYNDSLGRPTLKGGCELSLINDTSKINYLPVDNNKKTLDKVLSKADLDSLFTMSSTVAYTTDNEKEWIISLSGLNSTTAQSLLSIINTNVSNSGFSKTSTTKSVYYSGGGTSTKTGYCYYVPFLESSNFVLSYNHSDGYYNPHSDAKYQLGIHREATKSGSSVSISYAAYIRINKELTDFTIADTDTAETVKANIKAVLDQMYDESNIPEQFNTEAAPKSLEMNIFDKSTRWLIQVDEINSNKYLKLHEFNLTSSNLSKEEIDNIELELEIECEVRKDFNFMSDIEIAPSLWVEDSTHTSKLNYKYSADITIPENYGSNSLNRLKIQLNDYDREIGNISTFVDYPTSTSIRLYAKELPVESVIIEEIICE